MKVLLVNGSPNKDGCTDTALQEVARELAAQGIETEVFWLGRSAISGCIACRSCAKTGECFMDDGVNAFRAKAKEADGFIFGTPVHYAAASGSLTAFMDRLFFSDSGETFRLKPVAAVAVAALQLPLLLPAPLSPQRNPRSIIPTTPSAFTPTPIPLSVLLG